jgi:dienelactone hydrolase
MSSKLSRATSPQRSPSRDNSSMIAKSRRPITLRRSQLDARFAASVDRSRIGAAGFSLGGYTVLEVAGAERASSALRTIAIARTW